MTQATGRVASSLSRHAASSVDLPKPAGQATRVRRRSRPEPRRAKSGSRATIWTGTVGGWSFVTRRIGASGRFVPSSTVVTRRFSRIGEIWLVMLTLANRTALATGITEADDLRPAMPGEEPSVILRRLIDGHKVTQAIRVAVELGLPDRIAAGTRDPDELAAASGAHPPSLRRLLRALGPSGS